MKNYPGGKEHKCNKSFLVSDELETGSTFFPSGHFCHLLVTFENILDPDQNQQNVGPDLDRNCLEI